jgi:hypothetical protein
MVGGAAMYPSKNIIENAVNSKTIQLNFSSGKKSRLVETLQGKDHSCVHCLLTNATFEKNCQWERWNILLRTKDAQIYSCAHRSCR